MTDTSPRTDQDAHDTRLDGTPETTSRTPKLAALLVIAVAQLLIVLDATIVSVALPSAEADLHISEADRSWVVTVYSLAFGGLLLLGGRVADYLGQRRSLIIGLTGFAAASLLGAFAPDAAVLFLGRGLQGAFAAILAPSALSLLAVTFAEGKERTRAFAVFGGVSAAGGAIGLLLGGVLTEYLSWRWCLGVSTPIAIVVAVAGRLIFTETRDQNVPRLDLPGAVTVTGGLACLVVALGKASTAGWSATSTVSLLAVAAVLLAAFAVIESRSAAPLLPPRVVRDRNRSGAFLVQLTLGAALLVVFVFLTFFLQQTLGFSPLKTGLAFLPIAVGIAIGAVAYSLLAEKVRPGIQVPIGLLITAAGLALLTRIAVDSSYWADVMPALAALAFGVGLTLGPVQNIALLRIDKPDAGVASAMVDTTQQVGGAIGTAVFTTVFATAVSNYLSKAHGAASAADRAAQAALASIHGYHVAFWSGAGLLAVSAVITAVLINATRQQMSEVNEQQAGS